MSSGKISLAGGLGNVEHKLSKSRLGYKLDAMTEGLTDRCVIAIRINLLLWCKGSC